MRPVLKEHPPGIYTRYSHARNDLAARVGWYCSYCEMPVMNMIEVEHVIPRDNGGEELSWTNFLLSCKYCNTVKSARNISRVGYFWPDLHNTFLIFKYAQAKAISINSDLLTLDQVVMANATIALIGLDREPGSANQPTEADTRWVSRYAAWNIALRSLANWRALEEDSPALLEQIILTAKATGHFSIWMEVFKNFPAIKYQLIQAFPGTNFNFFDQMGNCLDVLEMP